MADILKFFGERVVPQSQPARPEQVQNNAGGYTFAVTQDVQVRRFLLLGTQSGSFYKDPLALTVENASAVQDMAKTDPSTLADLIHEVSTSGAAPRQQPTLFALAILMSTPNGAPHAQEIFLDVVRTSTHLFEFLTYLQQFRGWGRSVTRTVAQWYTSKTADQMAYQAVKYRSRSGWAHRDVLRKCHAKTADVELDNVFSWITHGVDKGEERPLPTMIRAHALARQDTDIVQLLERVPNLPWEALPDSARQRPDVWQAMLRNGMPMTALVRNLATMTRLGVFDGAGGKEAMSTACAQLTSPSALQRARVHPFSVLIAQRTYALGQGWRSNASWAPKPKIIDALDEAFYASFQYVEPTGQRYMLALDVSASMGGRILDSPLTSREAAAAMSLSILKTEDDVVPVAFTSGNSDYWNSPFTRSRSPETGAAAVTPLNISARQRLDDVLKVTARLPFGGTDCAAPMLYALKHNIEVDTFVIFTDSESWHGHVHPHEALRRYRAQTGIPARLVVCAFAANQFSVADPQDAGMLDLVGVDPSIPRLISEFSRGNL